VKRGKGLDMVIGTGAERISSASTKLGHVIDAETP